MKPAPNGGEARKLDTNLGRMPRTQGTKPVTHTPLAVEKGKMPRKMGGGRERDPSRR